MDFHSICTISELCSKIGCISENPKKIWIFARLIVSLHFRYTINYNITAMKKSILVCVVALLGFAQASAQDYERGIFNHLGANLSVGTEGISIGVAAPCTDYLEFGLGVNFMPGIKIKGDVNINAGTIPIGPDTYTFDKLKLEGSMSRTTFDFKVSAYPFGASNAFFLTAGLSFGGKEIVKLSGHNDEVARLYREHPEYTGVISAVVDEYDIKIDRQGNAEGDIRVNAVRPYVGLGYGRLVPKNRVGFRVELGCQFMGHMKVYQNGQQLDVDKAIKKGDDDISKLIDKLTVYPVLKFTLTGRIL